MRISGSSVVVDGSLKAAVQAREAISGNFGRNFLRELQQSFVEARRVAVASDKKNGVNPRIHASEMTASAF
jgi:hypothetical protein